MTNGKFNYECPKCKHTDSMRGDEHDIPLPYPTCTNAQCRYGYGEKFGMTMTGWQQD